MCFCFVGCKGVAELKQAQSRTQASKCHLRFGRFSHSGFAARSLYRNQNRCESSAVTPARGPGYLLITDRPFEPGINKSLVNLPMEHQQEQSNSTF
ncbi:hypothetical protein OSB04_027608 [Centaurea solstitialis]|uniref:Uncharacterized protein n=1 Tax=Centaurea solstitialis TaxID=347529 RepID=A0AA38VWV7_9ASTR|nr:hypothetical protein OSB04_027608 [Centaurea solstitialis]